MRVQFATAPKTRIHFGEMDDGGSPSPKEEKYHKMRYQFYLAEDTIKTDYRNGDIRSWRKRNKLLRQLAEREKTCMGCLQNNFDSNLKPIQKVEKSRAVIDRAITIRKANSLVAKFSRFIKSI